MKHSVEADVELLISLCLQCGVTVPEGTAREMVRYLAAIVEMNRTINLTRIETMEAGIRLHLLDSLTALPEAMSAIDGELCDIGTGGGFPGVPLALATGRCCVALDSVGKKATAVNEVLAELGMAQTCRAVPARAEAHARTNSGRYAVVTARALAPLPSVVELAAPLLRVGGTLLAFKGAPSNEEYASGERVAEIAGMSPGVIRELLLPGGGERRSIVSYTKVRKSSVSLPRREGLAQHSPLS